MAKEPKHNPLLIQQHTRLSASLLWQLQARFYEEKGMACWSQGIVPHYVSSHPFLAHCYAKMIIQRLSSGQSGPVYLLELGAGSGRFTFHFLCIFTH